MDQITKIVSAGLRDSAVGSAKQQPAKPPAVEVVKLPEGVPDMSAPFPPRFLVTTQARITRRKAHELRMTQSVAPRREADHFFHQKRVNSMMRQRLSYYERLAGRFEKDRRRMNDPLQR